MGQGVIPPAPPASAQPPTTITVDMASKIGPYKPIYSWFGYDEANYTTMRNGKALLRDLTDLSPVPVYIRAHHLLTSGDGKAELKFSSTNVYTRRRFRQARLRLHNPRRHLRRVQGRGRTADGGVRLYAEGSGRRPAGSHEPYQVHYPKSAISGASNNPPKDYAKWGELSSRCHSAPRGALRPRDRAAVVLRSVERAGHRLLALHRQRTTGSSTTTPSPACARSCRRRA